MLGETIAVQGPLNYTALLSHCAGETIVHVAMLRPKPRDAVAFHIFPFGTDLVPAPSPIAIVMLC